MVSDWYGLLDQLTEEVAVSTGPLTRSFGWSSSDVFVQHDVQELYHVLFENIQLRSAGSDIGQVRTHAGLYVRGL